MALVWIVGVPRLLCLRLVCYRICSATRSTSGAVRSTAFTVRASQSNCGASLCTLPSQSRQIVQTSLPPTPRHHYIGNISIACSVRGTCTCLVSVPDPYMSLPVDSKHSPTSGASGRGLVASMKGAFRGARNRARNALADDNQTADRGACLSSLSALLNCNCWCSLTH